MALIIWYDAGMVYPRRAYHDVVRRDRRASIRDENYATGKEPPNHPMPATIGFIDFKEQGEHTWLEYQGLLALWEYGWNDLEREQVCQYQDMECVQEYGDDAALINALYVMFED